MDLWGFEKTDLFEIGNKVIKDLNTDYNEIDKSLDFLINNEDIDLTDYGKYSQNRIRRQFLQDDISDVFTTYNIKKKINEYSNKLSGKDGLPVKTIQQRTESNQGSHIFDDLFGSSVSEDSVKPEQIVIGKQVTNKDLDNYVKNLKDINITNYLNKNFLKIDNREALHRITSQDTLLTNNNFILVNYQDDTKKILNFRIKNWKIPEIKRNINSIKYGNSVLSLPVNRYFQNTSNIEVEIILERSLNNLYDFMNLVGIGYKEVYNDEVYWNLSSFTNKNYVDLGDVELKIIPDWFINKEFNMGNKPNYYNILGDKLNEDSIIKEFPSYMFKNYQIKVLSLNPLSFSTKNKSPWTVKLNITFTDIYRSKYNMNDFQKEFKFQ